MAALPPRESLVNRLHVQADHRCAGTTIQDADQRRTVRLPAVRRKHFVPPFGASQRAYFTSVPSRATSVDVCNAPSPPDEARNVTPRVTSCAASSTTVDPPGRHVYLAFERAGREDRSTVRRSRRSSIRRWNALMALQELERTTPAAARYVRRVPRWCRRPSG